MRAPRPTPIDLTRARLLGIALALGGLAGACHSATERSGVSLSTRRTSYAAGDTVGVVLTTQTGRQLGFGACEPYAVDQSAGGAWREVYHSPTDEVCIAVPITVRDGGTFPLTVRLPQSLAPAAYRVRFDRFAPAATNSFDVR